MICASCAAPQSGGPAAASAGAAPEVVREYNNVNEDGTYDFGFEYSDGTFKTESKDADGNVKGLRLSDGNRTTFWGPLINDVCNFFSCSPLFVLKNKLFGRPI